MIMSGWKAAAALVAGLCLCAPAKALEVARADPKTPSSEPPTLEDFLAPPDLAKPRLSPSGKRLVVVRRAGDQDQLLLMEVANPGKAILLCESGHVSPELAKKKWRKTFSFIGWKSDDTLIVSLSVPVKFQYGDYIRYYSEPVHMMLDITGKAPAMIFNEKGKGDAGIVELSEIENVLHDDPDHILMMAWPWLQAVELRRVNIHTGKYEVVEHGGTDIKSYVSDRKGNVVMRYVNRGGGWRTIQGRAPGQTTWSKIVDIRDQDVRELAKYDFLGAGDIGEIYVAVKPETASEGDTKAVHTFDLRTMKLGPVVWSSPTYDVDSIVQDETTRALIGGCYWVDTYRCDLNDPLFSANLKGLSKYFAGDRSISIVSKSSDQKTWVILVEGPNLPGAFYIYDVMAHHIEPLGLMHQNLSEDRLATTRRFGFSTRDGARLRAYVTEPRDRPSRAPLVVMPHGGPEQSDHYSFDVWAQYLAAHGYTVLQPNFRGSGGFGRKFAEAGYGEWGGRMHEDVMDATRALIAEGKVDPDRLCIVGGSYGGYEALYSAAVEPSTFRCAVSVAGVSDLVGVMKFERTFGTDSARYKYWVKSQGDPTTDEAKMRAHSPFRLAANWKTPTLLIHGDADDIVPVEESRQMKRALESAGKPVRYLEIHDMGHGPSKDEDWRTVLTEIDTFLAAHIGPGAPAATVPASTTR